MSSLDPCKVAIEVFKTPGFFDDHFGSWVADPAAGCFRTGDTLKLIVQAGKTWQLAHVDMAIINVDTHPYLAIRVGSFSGTRVIVSVKEAGSTHYYNLPDITSGNQLYLKRIKDYAPGITQIDAVDLTLYGDVYSEATFDYVAVTAAVNDVGVYGVDYLEVNDVLLNDGVADAFFLIPNNAEDTKPSLNARDVLLIYLNRDASSLISVASKVFGGRICNPEYIGRDWGKFYRGVSAFGHAEEFLAPQSLLLKRYDAVNGRTILEDSLVTVAYCKRHLSDDYWFDASGLQGFTDDRIMSTHDIETIEQPAFETFKDVLENAKASDGAQGFDVCVMPSGSLIGHKRNSVDFTSGVAALTPDGYRRGFDSVPVRNKAKVYGGWGGKFPPAGDWCENTSEIVNWAAETGSIGWDEGTYHDGSRSLKGVSGAGYLLQFYRTFSPWAWLSGFPRTSVVCVGRLNFWAKASVALTLTVSVWTPPWTSFNYYTKQFSVGTDWTSCYSILGDATWTVVGSPDWTELTRVRFSSMPGAAHSVNLDALHFSECRVFNEVQDDASILAYGQRHAELHIDDALKSANECTIRGQSLLNSIKAPVTTLQDVTFDGGLGTGYNRCWPGYRQEIVVANDGYDEYSRITRVKQMVRGGQWDTTLTLANNPIFYDQVFTKNLERIRRLTRSV